MLPFPNPGSSLTLKETKGRQAKPTVGQSDFFLSSEAAQSCLTLCDPMDSSLPQAPASMGSSSQEYWSGLPFPSPGNLPNPGIEPRSPAL